MKQAVMFDLDGTLINSLADIARSMNMALEQNGLPRHPEEKYKLFTGDGAVNLARRALGERQDMLDKVYLDYRDIYARNSRVKTAPYPGITKMLRQLNDAGIQIIVLSNKDNSDANNVVRFYFPDIVFAKVQGREEGVPVKPDPTLARRVMAELRLTPDNMWYVGDTKTDMACARNIGADGIAVTWGFQTREMLEEAKPFCFADSAEELLKILLQE